MASLRHLACILRHTNLSFIVSVHPYPTNFDVKQIKVEGMFCQSKHKLANIFNVCIVEQKF